MRNCKNRDRADSLPDEDENLHKAVMLVLNNLSHFNHHICKITSSSRLTSILGFLQNFSVCSVLLYAG